MTQNLKFLLDITPSSGIPIYRQLVEQLERMILSGSLEVDTYLPSVRATANELEVNPMTVSKAYSYLEAKGLIVRDRGKGMRISEIKVAGREGETIKLLEPAIQELIKQAKQLRLEDEQIIKAIRKILSEEI